MSARRPATGADRSPPIRQAMLAGPKKPSSAGWSGMACTRAAADRSTRPAASAYSLMASRYPHGLSAGNVAAGWRIPVEKRAVRDDPARVEVRVRGVVVPLDLVEPERAGEGGERVQIPRVRPQ